MLVHVLDALIVLKVPDFDVALTDCYKDVFLWNGVDGGNTRPMAFVYHAQLTFKNVNQVNIHVFAAEEKHAGAVLLDGGDRLGGEWAQIVFFAERSFISIPHPEVTV